MESKVSLGRQTEMRAISVGSCDFHADGCAPNWLLLAVGTTLQMKHGRGVEVQLPWVEVGSV